MQEQETQKQETQEQKQETQEYDSTFSDSDCAEATAFTVDYPHAHTHVHEDNQVQQIQKTEPAQPAGQHVRVDFVTVSGGAFVLAGLAVGINVVRGFFRKQRPSSSTVNIIQVRRVDIPTGFGSRMLKRNIPGGLGFKAKRFNLVAYGMQENLGFNPEVNLHIALFYGKFRKNIRKKGLKMPELV
jgi:hypothetical protein